PRRPPPGEWSAPPRCGCRRMPLLGPVPRLEHDHVPQQVLPVAGATKMLGPLLTDRLHGEESALTQTPLGQQILRPVAQLTPEPAIDRYPEAHLGPLDQLPRHMPVQHLPEEPLPLAVAHLVSQRDTPRELHHA